MPKQAIIGGQVHTFPDDATDAEIDAIAVSMLGGAEKPAPRPAAPATKQIIFEGKSYTFPADATPDEMDALLPKSKPATAPLQQLKDNRLMHDMQGPYMIPQSTAQGDPDLRKVEESDPLMYAAGTVANVAGSAADAARGLGTFLYKGAQAMGGNTEAGMELMDQLKGLPGVIAQRYGGVENVKRTLHDDPVGMALEVAPVVKGVPAVVSGARSAAARLPGAAIAKDAATGLMVGGPKGAVANAARGVVKRSVIDPLLEEIRGPKAEAAPKPMLSDAADRLREASAVKAPERTILDNPRGKRGVPAVVARETIELGDDAARLREMAAVEGSGPSALDLQRGRVADPVVDRPVPEPAPTVDLGDEAARLRESLGVEGEANALDNPRARNVDPIRGEDPAVLEGESLLSPEAAAHRQSLGVIDGPASSVQRGRQASPPAIIAREAPAAAAAAKPAPTAKPAKPVANPEQPGMRAMGKEGGRRYEDILASERLKEMGQKPKPTEAAKPAPATQPDVTTTAKPEAAAPEGPKSDAPGSKSKAARGDDHRYSPNDRKVYAENIRKGMTEDDAHADVVRQRADRAKANYEREAAAAKAKREAAAAKTEAAPAPTTLKDALVKQEVETQTARESTLSFKSTGKQGTFRTEDGRYEMHSTGVYGEPVTITDLKTGKTVTGTSVKDAKAKVA